MATCCHATQGSRGPGTASITALEFYSGIGGMHCALHLAAQEAQIGAVEVLAAFDINEVANRVYAHNFGAHLVRQARC
jgi:tRNA (cytosine38-C5)-methyltransferase